MALFPIRELAILKLATTIVKGLTDNTAIFPSPPVSPAELRQALDRAAAARDNANVAYAAAERATAEKNAALQELAAKMRRNLRYAENATGMDDRKLRLLGWGKPQRGRPAHPPGKVRSLEAPQHGDGQLHLDWKPPVDGGRVVAYRVECRNTPEDLIWSEVITTGQTAAVLENLESGVEREYRVVAFNKSGDGDPGSSIVIAL